MKDVTVGTTTTKRIITISTGTSFRSILNGSPFFDLSGNLVGLKLSQTENGIFTPIAIISASLVWSTNHNKILLKFDRFTLF